MPYVIPESTNTANVGAKSPNKQTAWCGAILVKKDMEIDTEANALLLATWLADIKAAEPNRAKPLGVCVMNTPEDAEDTIRDSRFKGGKVVYSGKIGFTMEFDISVNAHKEWFKLNDRTDWGVYLFDDNDNIYGYSPDGAKFKPYQCLTMQVLRRGTTAEDQDGRTKVKFVLANTDTIQRQTVIINPTAWSPKDLEGVHNVELSVTNPWTATTGVVRVTYKESGEPVTGLVVGDFAISGKVITSATPSGDGGTYTIVSSALSTSSIDLVACASISLTTIAIESTGAANFTV